MSSPRAEVTLDNCDREPIHIPGAIQSHGCLLAYDSTGDARLTHSSLNAERLLGTAPPSRMADLLPSDTMTTLTEQDIARSLFAHPLHLGRVELATGRTLELSAHRYEGRLILELEPPPAIPGSHVQVNFQSLLKALGQARDLDRFLETLAQGVRTLSGLDRVMVYRFLPDWSGEVVVESGVPNLKEHYLGLRFPPMDIPKPARAVFEKLWVRTIPAAHAEETVIRAHSQDQEPLDLTYAVLRGVSPMHVEYLDNMGVEGTLTISLKVRGQLWGLVACHHYSPYAIDAANRSAFEVLGQLTSAYLGHLLAEQATHLEFANRETLDQAVELVETGPEEELLALLQELVPCDGLAVVHNTTVWSRGTVPAASEIHLLREALRPQPEEALLAVDNLAQHYPGCRNWQAPLRGLMYLSLNAERVDAVLWFRLETERVVRWGGRPDSKIVKTGPNGPRLHPRSSFEEYLEKSRDLAPPWSEKEVGLARLLRGRVQQRLQVRLRDLADINRRLQEVNAELDTFTHIASHDLKEPLRGIHNYATYLVEDYAAQLEDDGQYMLARIRHLTRRMDRLLDSLLGLAQLSQEELELQEIRLDEVVEESLAILGDTLKEHNVNLESEGLDLGLTTSAVFLQQIVTNLVSNAVKYGGEYPHIRLAAQRKGDRIVFQVSDDGEGVAPEDQERIFELLARKSQPDATRSGFGIGLHIVKKMVERLGGEVAVESQTGKGSTFTVTLPDGKPGD